jgi:chitodextrinase
MPSQGANSPSIQETDSYSDFGYSTGNITANDGLYRALTNAGVAGSTDTGRWIKARDFGFSIPSGAIIDGILVEINRYNPAGQNGYIRDNIISIIKSDGSIGTINKAITDKTWAESDPPDYVSYGGSDDKWEETWSPADINSSNFGVYINPSIYKKSKGIARCAVDHVRITVYYTEGSTVYELTAQGDVDAIILQYEDVVKQPLVEFEKLVKAGWKIDAAKAAECVTESLYRSRLDGGKWQA